MLPKEVSSHLFTITLFPTLTSFPGADGSLLLDPSEVLRPANAGLDRARNALLPVWQKYKSYGISAADLVQFAHNVAVTTCPLGPRTLTYIGRKDWKPEDGRM